MMQAYHFLAKGANRGQSVLLLAALAAVSGVLGWVLSGAVGFFWAMVLAGCIALFAPRMAPSVLMRGYGARLLSPYQVPGVHDVVSDMARRAGLSRAPVLYYVPSGAMNAFAVGGRDDAGIAVTAGLLNRVDFQQLAGVLAHEISHIVHGDIGVMTLADIFTRITAMFSTLGKVLLLINLPLLLVGEVTVSWWLVLALLLAPVVSTLLQLALSRTREFDADAMAARLTGDPLGLATALAKIEYQQESVFRRVFLPGAGEQQSSILRSHPVTQERVERLRKMAYESWAQPRYVLRQPVQRQMFGTIRPRWRFGSFWLGR